MHWRHVAVFLLQLGCVAFLTVADVLRFGKRNWRANLLINFALVVVFNVAVYLIVGGLEK